MNNATWILLLTILVLHGHGPEAAAEAAPASGAAAAAPLAVVAGATNAPAAPSSSQTNTAAAASLSQTNAQVAPSLSQTNAPVAASLNQTNAAAAASGSQTNLAGAAPSSAPARDIRFQFDGIPYADVVTRFSQMANKPLLGDLKIEGTLQFIDPQPYTYSEALETLNLILATKGMILVETGRYLRLVPLKELAQMPLKIFRGLDRTGDTSPGEVVTVVLSLQNLEAQEVSQTITPMLSSAGSVAPLSRGRGVIITDQLGNIRRIRDLLAEVDTASPVQRQMRTYTLMHSSGAVVSDLINKTFGQATAPKRVEFNQQSRRYEVLPPDPSDYVTAIFDEASRTMVLYGPADRVELAESLIKRFEDQAGSRAGEVRVYQSQSIPAADLARLVRQAVPGVATEYESGSSAATKARVIADPVSNRIIVTAPVAGQLDAIEALIKRLDVGSDGAFRELRTLALKHTSATAMASMISQLFARQYRVEDPHQRVLVAAAPDDRTLLIDATGATFDKIEEMVRGLDVESARGSYEVRTYRLTGSNAGELAQTLARVFSDRQDRRRFEESGGLAPRFEADSGANVLIVAAPRMHFEAIEKLIEELRAPAEVAQEIRTFPLQHASAEQMASVLESLLRGERGMSPYRSYQPYYPRSGSEAGRLRVMPAPGANAVVVQGPPEKLAQAETLIRELDRADAVASLEVRTYRLTGSNAAELAQTLARLFGERQGQRRAQPAGALAPRFEADTGANALIVAAQREQFESIEKLIEELRAPAVVANEIRTFRLRHTTADQVTSVLETMLRTDGRSYSGYRSYYQQYSPYGSRGASDASGLRISGVPGANVVVIQGPPEKLTQAEALIQALDQPESATSLEVRTYRLTGSNAAELSQSLARLFSERQGQRRAEPGALAPRFEADTGANALIVAAQREQFETIEKLIEELRAPAVVANEIRTFRLRHTTADQVTPVLETMLRTDGRSYSGYRSYYQQYSPYGSRGGSDASGLRISSVPGANVVVIQGPSDKLTQAEALIQALDQPESATSLEVRTYRLTGSNAAELSQSLARLFSERQGQRRAEPGALAPRFEADLGANALIVAAQREQFETIEKLIEELRAPAVVANEIRTFRLQHTTADQVTPVLETMLRSDGRSYSGYRPYSSPYGYSPYGSRGGSDASGLRISGMPGANTVVVQGPSDKLAQAEALIQALDQPESASSFEVRTYRLTSSSAGDLAQSLARLFSERQGQRRDEPRLLTPRFEADMGANALIVAAAREQFEAIEKLIEELRAQSETAVEMRTFHLQYTTADQMTMVLETMLRSDGRSSSGYRPYYSPYGGFRGGSGDATGLRISAVSGANAVVVQGPPAKVAQAEALVRDLDRPDSDEAATIQTVQLRRAQAEPLSEAIGRILSGRSPPNRPRRVQVSAVPGSNSLLVDGPPAEVKEVIQIIRQLDEESVDGGIEIRVYQLENGEARELSRVVSQLLQSLPRRGSRFGRSSYEPTVGVAADERTNSLIVTGTPEVFRMLEQLLPSLDQTPDRSNRDVAFYWLTNAYAPDVASQIEAIYADRSRNEQVLVETDSLANSLTVVARKSDLVEIGLLVEKLDAAALDTTVQVRLVPMGKMSAAEMAVLLTNIYPQMSSGQMEIVDKLPGPPAAAPAPLLRSPSTNDPAVLPAPSAGSDQPLSAPATEPGVTNAPRPVLVAVDPVANALILSGPANELDQIESIILDLQMAATSEAAELRMFPLQEADPVALARTLNEIFRSETTRSDAQRQSDRDRDPNRRGAGGEEQRPPPQQQQQQQPPPPPPPKVVIVAESRTRSLIARGSAADLKNLEGVIRQLDVAGVVAELGYRVTPLRHSSADKLLPLVSQVVTQLNLARPGDPVTVIRDPRGGALFLVGRTNLLDRVAGIVADLDSPADYAETQVRLIPLKNAQAPQLAALLQEMLRPAAGGGARAQAGIEARELQEQVRRLRILDDDGQPVALDLDQPIKVLADPIQGSGAGSNRLLLASTPANLRALEVLVAMMDTVPLMEGITARLVHLKHADATAVSQMLNSVFQQGQRMADPASRRSQTGARPGGVLASGVNVAVDRRSNTLILSGSEESLAMAQNLIAQLDQEVDSQITEVRLFRLKYASASRMAPLLQSVFSESRGGAGVEGLRVQISRLQTILGQKPARTTEIPGTRPPVVIQADDTTNILIVAARSDTMPLIEDVVSTMDIPAASGLATIRIYPLQHADAASVQRLINDLYRGPTANQVRQEDRPSVTVDPRTNALVVSGNDNAFAIVASLLDRLDQPLPAGMQNIQIIPLQNADAATLAGSIQRILDARSGARGGAGRGFAAETMRAVIIGDPRTNSLLVGGPTDMVEMVRSLAGELDKASPALSSQVRLIPLEHATAQTLSAALTTLFSQRAVQARQPDAQRTRPIIIADPRSNSLLVAAGVEDNQVLDALLAKLDREPETPAVALTVIGLTHNDSARVAPMISRVFTARRQSMAVPGQAPLPQDQVHVEPDTLSNALVVSASPENLELIRNLLAKVDVEPVAAEGILQTFTLKQADAQRAAVMLRSLIDQGLYRPGQAVSGARGSPRDAIAVAVDPLTNTLIVSASPENLAVVRELIAQIDAQAGADAGNIQVVALKHARASQLATVLEQFFRAKRAAEATGAPLERSVPVTVTPDDRTNTLLVTGGRESLAALERMITQLDVEQSASRTTFKVFPLRQTTASKIQATLQQLFLRRPAPVRGQPPEPITVVADSWSNSLAIGAAPEDFPMIESLIAQLDSAPTEGGLEVQVFSLAKADARRVAQTIQALYRGGGTVAGLAAPVTVNVDERLNALVVSAGQADVKRIAELIKKLDTDQVAQVSEIRIFPLQHAYATQLATILSQTLNVKPAALTEQSANRQSLLQFITRSEEGRELVASALKEGILVTPDPRTNSLIVSAPVDYMDMLERLIRQLDTNIPQVAKIRVFNLRNADARQMSTLLTSVFRLQAVTTAASGINDRSVQYTLVRPASLDSLAGQDTVEGTTAILGSAEKNALTVTVDLRTNSLLVGGTDHYVALAAELINTLDGSPAQERKSEVYRLKNSRAREIETALQNFLRRDTQLLSAAVGQQAMAQEILDREVAIVAETNSNTLLLSASQRYFDQVKTLIEQLDMPQLQVLIQVLLAEVTLDASSQLGVEWNYSDLNGTKVTTGTDFGVSDDLNALGGFSTAVTGSDFNFLLRALESDGRLLVLSRPQILTADNQEATINIGQQVPLITDSRVTERGDSINSYEYRNVGVELTVTPRISPDGFVKMDVGPRISQMSSSDVEISPGTKVPVINERSATTTVSVQSGQSIIIGGLISSVDDSRVKRMPFLGRIPVIGVLFRSSHKSEDRKELLIVLTPQVLIKGTDVGITREAISVTREQLDRSTMNEEFKQDRLQRQMLDPLYPPSGTNATRSPNPARRSDADLWR